MMAILTKAFTVTKKQLFGSLFRIYIGKRWWLFLIVALIAAFLFFSGRTESGWWIIGVLIALPIVTAFSLAFLVYFKMGKDYFSTYHLIIEEQKLTAKLQNGKSDHIYYNQIKQAVHTKDYIFMIAKNGALVYIPTSAFNSDKEYKQFSNILKRHGL